MNNLLIECVVFTCIAAFACLISHLLKNGTEKIRRIPFVVIAIVLLAMEAAKQVYSLIEGYNLYYLPFQICSLFLFSYTLMAFAHGKLRNYAMCINLCLGCSASLAQLFLSQVLTRDYIFKLFTAAATPFHYHNVIYHHIVFLHFIFMLLLKPYKPQKRHILPTVFIYALFMIISCIAANLLKTNFSGYINYGAPVFDYFKRFGQAIFNMVGFCLNTLEYLLGVAICFFVHAIVSKRNGNRAIG
jgi:uncharacterized membrane protein YwaF